MKSFVLLLAAAVATVSSAPITSKSAKTEGFVALEVVGTRSNVHPNPRFANNPNFISTPPPSNGTFINGTEPIAPTRRSTTASASLGNLFTYYQIQIEVGTPAQTVSPTIDTGSSDLWAVASNNSQCTSNANFCAGQTFDFASSSTWEFNQTKLDIQYLDGTFAQGEWGTDVVSLGDGAIVIDSCSFGVGLDATVSEGVFGISFPTQESTPQQYPNVPQLLRDQGFIETVAYSLWLNDVHASSGTLLFGGVDHAKYEGQLYTIPLVAPEGQTQPLEMLVSLTAVLATDSFGFQMYVGSGADVVLDSGTTVTYLPKEIVDGVAATLGATFDESINVYTMNCSAGDNTAQSVTYDLSGAQINVGLSELLLPLFFTNGDVAIIDGEALCYLGLSPTTNGVNVLGDTFLRSAYVVYDLENFEVSLANTVFNTTSSNIEAITSSGVPGTIHAPNF